MTSANTSNITTIEMAIRSGLPDKVEDLLEPMSDDEAIDCLTSTYGLEIDQPDDNGLFKGVIPVLHAARSGNPDVFASVLHAMRARLGPQQIQDMVKSQDDDNNSLLALAVASKNEAMFNAAMACVERHVSSQEIKAMLMHTDSGRQSLVACAAESGDKATFEAVITVLREELQSEQIKAMLMHTDSGRQSLVACAAESGDKATFEAVITVLREELQSEQIKAMLMHTDSGRQSLVACAAESGDKATFEAVITVLQEKLQPEQIKAMLMHTDSGRQSLVACAAESGDKATFEAVITVLREELQSEQIKAMLMHTDSGRQSLVACAAESGDKATFQAVITVLQEKLQPEQIEEMLMRMDYWEESLLFVAARSGNKATFEAVMTALQEKLQPEQIEEMLMRTDNWGQSLLFVAVRSGDKATFEAVMTALQEKLQSEQIETMLTHTDSYGQSLLFPAAVKGYKATFEAAITVLREELQPEQIETMLMHADSGRQSLVFRASRSGDKATFEAVMTALREKLQSEQIETMLMHTDSYGQSLLFPAAVKGYKATFEAVMTALREELQPEQIEKMLMHTDSRGQSLLFVAARSEDKATFEAVITALEEKLQPEQMRQQLTSGDMEPLRRFIEVCSTSLCRIMLQVFEKYAADPKVAKALDNTFPAWHTRYQGHMAAKESEAIFVDLIHHSAYPTSGFLQERAHGTKDEWERFAELVLLAIESTKNPLVAGMSLSIALADAAERAREGEERKISGLRRTLDNFMMEVLKRLPQTVRDFKNGVWGCSGLFEPEGPRENPIGRPGPLRLAFSRRQQIKKFYDAPLVRDYMSNRFTCGLPDLRDTQRILRNDGELDQLAYARDDLMRPRLLIGGDDIWWLQGVQTNYYHPALTVLPGAQFIIVGLVKIPRSYYRVPAMRMAMDFVVYLAMLVAFYNWVLLHGDGPVTLGEILFAFYIVAGICGELEELRQNFSAYLQDQWNYLDALGFLMLSGGMIARFADSNSPWGRSLYALSAPPIFSRLLFFAQILKFQAPMIQAMFSMATVLMQFGVILVVVLMGFATSFFSLFRDVDSFGETLLHLFKTTLGDVALFDDLDNSSREPYAAVGYLLLVIFVIVVTIMLLNLVIAILSTKHADVNTQRDFKVSMAQTLEHYRLAVELDILPAPFNVLQTFVSLPFFALGRQRSDSCRRVKRAVGQVIFWFALSPIAIVAGTLLWVASIPHVISLLRNKPIQISFRYGLVSFPVYLARFLGLPIFLVAMWLKEPFMWIMQIYEFLSKRTPSVIEQQDVDDVDVQNMLKEVGASASELRKYLENPMIDPNVQRDEVDRGTTVKHVKLLRDHLKERIWTLSANTESRVFELRDEIKETFSSTERRVSELRDEIKEKFSSTERRVSELRDDIKEKFSITERRVSELRDDINEKFAKVLKVLEMNTNSGSRAGAAT